MTATDIHIATVTDKGFTGRSGLNKEMVDTTTALAAWCNEHGGILGRKVIVDDRDAKLTDYNAVVTTSCDEDLAMVGGGAVFDDGDNGLRVQCGLPNIPGFVVTPTARVDGAAGAAAAEPRVPVRGRPAEGHRPHQPGSVPGAYPSRRGA